MAGVEILWNKGYVSSRDRADLESGELTQASGCWYKPGDRKRLWQQKGATEYEDITAESAIKGVGLISYDDGNSFTLAYAGTDLYYDDAGLTGTLASLVSGLNASATKHSVVHSNDKWFWCNGYDPNRVLKSDGAGSGTVSVISHGMQANQNDLTATASTGVGDLTLPNATDKDTAGSGSFTNPGYACDDVDGAFPDDSGSADSDNDTFALAPLSAAGSVTHTWTIKSKDYTDYQLNIRYALAGVQNPLRQTPDGDTGGTYGVGGTIHGGFNVGIQIEYREGAGAWADLVNTTRESSTSNTWAQVNLSSSTNTIDVRATLTYNSGTSPATLRIYTIYAQKGSDAATFELENEGLYYAFSEYDDVNGHLSPPSNIIHVSVADFGTNNQVELSAFPVTPQNSRATLYYIYRTTDTLSVFGEPNEAVGELGKIGQILVSDAANGYTDMFAVNNVDKDTQNYPLVPMVTIGGSRGILRVPQDSPQPSFQWMGTFKGRLIGISRDFLVQLQAWTTPGPRSTSSTPSPSLITTNLSLAPKLTTCSSSAQKA